MWEIPKHGEAEFYANGWKLAVATASDGVSLVASRKGLAASRGRLGIPQAELAACREKYIRGDALHLALSDPQSDPLGLDLVLMAVEADQNVLILESVISLGTSLLDSHPTVEVQIDAGAGKSTWDSGSWSPPQEGESFTWVQARSASPQAQTPARSQVLGSVLTAVLCDDRDRLSLDHGALENEGRLKFFGDFLEKGVIRKVQPWWIWSSEPVSDRSRRLIAGHLAARPLPLSS